MLRVFLDLFGILIVFGSIISSQAGCRQLCSIIINTSVYTIQNAT